MRNYLMLVSLTLVCGGFYYAIFLASYHGVTAMVAGAVMFLLVVPTQRKGGAR